MSFLHNLKGKLNINAKEQYLNELILRIEKRQNALEKQQYEMDYAMKSRVLEMDKKAHAYLSNFKDIYHSMQLVHKDVQHMEANIYNFGSVFQEKMQNMLEDGIDNIIDITEKYDVRLMEYDSHLKDFSFGLKEFAYGLKDEMNDIVENARGYSDLSKTYSEKSKEFADEARGYRDETFQYGETFKKDLKHHYDNFINEADNRLQMMDNLGDKWYREIKHTTSLYEQHLKNFDTEFKRRYEKATYDIDKKRMEGVNDLQEERNRIAGERGKLQNDALKLDNDRLRLFDEQTKLQQNRMELKLKNIEAMEQHYGQIEGLKDKITKLEFEKKENQTRYKNEINNVKTHFNNELHKREQRYEKKVDNLKSDFQYNYHQQALERQEQRRQDAINKAYSQIRTTTDERVFRRRFGG